MNSILVPVDFSEVSVNLADIAGGLAKALHASVELLHVLPQNFEAEELGRPNAKHAIEHLNPKDAQAMEDLKNHAQLNGCSVTMHVAEGATVPTILQRADELNVDLIIMGSHGHTTLHHLLVGSVSEGVLRKSHYPVLVVPSPSIEKHRRTQKLN